MPRRRVDCSRHFVGSYCLNFQAQAIQGSSEITEKQSCVNLQPRTGYIILL